MEYEISYDRVADILMIYWDNAPAISMDYGGDFWLRINPQTNMPVGIEIENFKSHFLKKYMGNRENDAS